MVELKCSGYNIQLYIHVACSDIHHLFFPKNNMIDVFFNLYRISNYWFNVAQVVFLIWNAINDPLFGYFQVSSQPPKEVK